LFPSGLENATKLTFVLRCVEEWTEVRGTGKHRHTAIIHEQIWAATRTTEWRVDCRPLSPVSLRFDVPATAPGSDMSGKQKITFGELDVSAEAPGVDLQKCYLVPVCAARL
jgi:hypothetical protein